MLLPRLLSAVVGIPLLLFFIHLGSLPFLAFVAGTAVLALYEYGLVLWLGGRGVQRFNAAAGGGLLALAVGLGGRGGGPRSGDLGWAVLALLTLWVVLREMFRREHSLDRAALTLFGAVFVGWSLGHLALLRELRPHGERLTLFLFLTVWITDMAAYAAGRGFGRRPLAPRISPKKTWEGAVAGVAGALLFSAAAERTFLGEALGLKAALAAGLLIGVLGQLSDLAESVVKRAAGVKDSSDLLPGHGGVLDRFDSFLLTAPLLYYALLLKFR